MESSTNPFAQVDRTDVRDAPPTKRLVGRHSSKETNFDLRSAISSMRLPPVSCYRTWSQTQVAGVVDEGNPAAIATTYGCGVA